MFHVSWKWREQPNNNKSSRETATAPQAASISGITGAARHNNNNNGWMGFEWKSLFPSAQSHNRTFGHHHHRCIRSVNTETRPVNEWESGTFDSVDAMAHCSIIMWIIIISALLLIFIGKYRIQNRSNGLSSLWAVRLLSFLPILFWMSVGEVDACRMRAGCKHCEKYTIFFCCFLVCDGTALWLELADRLAGHFHSPDHSINPIAYHLPICVHTIATI